jgi:hypothetical protein
MPHLMRDFRLDASLEQAETLRQWNGCARLAWNLALEQQRIAWEFTRGRTDDRRSADQPRPSYVRQCAELTQGCVGVGAQVQPDDALLSSFTSRSRTAARNPCTSV